MSYIKGKYKSSIFEADSGYKVGLFKVNESDDQDISLNKTITFTGYFGELTKEDLYIFYGDYIYHDKYGYQFQTKNYEKIVPEGKDAIIEFLTSSFVKGCGESTAKKIYNVFGDNTLEKIKENKGNLLLVEGLNEKKAMSIYDSVIKYFAADKEILALKNMGFSIKETMSLINIYGKYIMEIINNDIYKLIDYIDFKKLDNIFLKNHEICDEKRILACIIESMKELTFASGDIYLDKIEIVEYLSNVFNIDVDINDHLDVLFDNKEIMIINGDYYLMSDYLDELNNASSICKILNLTPKALNNITKYIKLCEEEFQITYNDEQISAIKTALSNNISVITGGPGTGKTTILKGIVKIYSLIHKLDDNKISNYIALLAPTGRAAKRMSESTGLYASTIHRFLKWDKESNTFGINELNKVYYKLIIIDETSMIDNHLLSALFKGIDLNTQIIFVGDEYQLPSVGPGLILNDMIAANLPHINLHEIYRQSDNSFIPVLAREIKETDIKEDILDKKDDFNFIKCSNHEIKNLLTQILIKIKEKKIDVSHIQVLAPMYKGENGIDNLNIILQEIFNPKSSKKDEVSIGPITYRVGDKILNLVNDIDNNIYNGDIGFITEINLNSKTDFLIIDYYGNEVSYKKDNLNSITHAYAITIHKSQGSEFDHVIMPMSLSYSRMLYNKLLYTGVSRAKKSLVIIGSMEAFNKSVNNNYSYIRKTSLKQKILNNINNNG
jgi:exodeoxyribonuclease V alpha subunit